MAIDPRISARRVAVRRAEGRRRLRFLIGAVGLVALAVGAWGLTRTPLLDLDHVRIDGVTGADVSDVDAAAGLVNGTPMFDLDLGAIERDLAALPWVDSARAEREWPGTVRVTVQPRVPVAVVGTQDSETFLADADGVLIRRAAEEDVSGTGLPRIAVEPSADLGEIEAVALPAIVVAMALPDDLRSWVEAITLDRRSAGDELADLGLDLVGSGAVHLGAVDFVEDKLAAVRAVLDGTDLTCLDVIDVAVADLPTVTRDEECEAGTPDPPGGGDA